MTRSGKFKLDRIAISFAVAGMILMALTLVWRINPVEGSVIPDFFHHHPLGRVIFWILFVTCMPVFVLAASLPTPFPGGAPTPWTLICAAMIALQCILYFLIGKGVAVCIRLLRKKGLPSNR